MNITKQSCYVMKRCMAFLMGTFLIAYLGMTTYAEESIDTEIIVTATDDNTNSSDLRYAIPNL